jgi:bromodomain-containing factor 1
MRSKLESGAYHTAEKFRDDFKLIISNCNLYNPPGTLVHQAGIELKKLFEEKWKGLLPLQAEFEPLRMRSSLMLICRLHCYASFF